jgi:hypothetical protein
MIPLLVTAELRYDAATLLDLLERVKCAKEAAKA